MSLRETLTARVEESRREAELKLAVDWDAPIKVLFDLRGYSLGIASVRDGGVFDSYRVKRIIRLNLAAAEADLGYCLKQTIPHEVAHHAESAKYGRLSHSPTWRRMFMALGGDGNTKADAYKGPVIKARRTRKAIYILPQAGRVNLPMSSHRAIANGARVWIRGTKEPVTIDHYSHEELV